MKKRAHGRREQQRRGPSKPSPRQRSGDGRDAALSVHRSFVVTLSASSDPSGELVGRVEHVVSGRAAEFDCAQELAEFFSRVVTNELAEEP